MKRCGTRSQRLNSNWKKGPLLFLMFTGNLLSYLISLTFSKELSTFKDNLLKDSLIFVLFLADIS